MSHSLVWHSSYLSWLLESFFLTFLSSISVLKQALKTALGRGYMESREIPIVWAFVRGKWAGIVKIIRMDVQERQAFLGAAKLASSNN